MYFRYSVGWLAGWLVGWLAGWLVGWLAGWLVGWLAGWLVGWLAGWLLAGWLVGPSVMQLFSLVELISRLRNLNKNKITKLKEKYLMEPDIFFICKFIRR